MKQLLQRPGSGDVYIADVPAPALPAGSVLVRTAASVLSAGTERMILDFAGKSLVGKAVARPDLVRQVIEKVRRDGLVTTFDAVRNRLDTPAPLGYSSAGIVIDRGADVSGFPIGSAVACAGAGFANHAEINAVPVNLCAPVPAGVPLEEAAFATIGAIAMHGLRLSQPQLGSTVAVIGLGLLGQLAVQFAHAAGCRVVGIDLRPERNALARQLGAAFAVTPENAEDAVRQLAPAGADAVLITADAQSNEPIELAAVLARDRATVVAVGSVGLDIPRRTYFAKELTFLVSRSYGPGRYDSQYEIEGRDYPIGYVRWTEQRNLTAVLDLMADSRVRVGPLITHRYPVDEALRAYEAIRGATPEPSLGVVLTFASAGPAERIVRIVRSQPEAAGGSRTSSIGVLGAGNFAAGTLLPALVDAGATIAGIASAQGVTATACVQRFHAQYATTDEKQITADPAAAAVVIATRHHLHAGQVLAARAAGKHVFVEKPLCLTEDELVSIIDAFEAPGSPILMVGYNRRFAPLTGRLMEFFADVREPKVVQYRVNAGYVPRDHWTQDPRIGGGRIIGEACHFVDFASFVIGERPSDVSAAALPDSDCYSGDNAVITIRYPSGGLATIAYLACGANSMGKERIEVSAGGRTAVLEDFRSLMLHSRGRAKTRREWLRQDKGHRAECRAFMEAITTTGKWPVALHDLAATSRATFAALESVRTGRPVAVPQ